MWVPVLSASKLKDAKPVVANYWGTPVVIFRAGDHIVALRDVCPHRGAKLSDGDVISSSAEIRCPFHGYRFGPQGDCRWTPPTANVKKDECQQLTCHRFYTQERYGRIWLSANDEPFPFADDIPSNHFVCNQVASGHPQIWFDHYLDTLHLVYSHGASTFGIAPRDEDRVNFTFHPNDDFRSGEARMGALRPRWFYERMALASSLGQAIRACFDRNSMVRVRAIGEMLSPCALRLELRYESSWGQLQVHIVGFNNPLSLDRMQICMFGWLEGSATGFLPGLKRRVIARRTAVAHLTAEDAHILAAISTTDLDEMKLNRTDGHIIANRRALVEYHGRFGDRFPRDSILHDLARINADLPAE